jgi:hypothetical protein
MTPSMRHRLFHAIVLVGASLPIACSDDASSATPAVDAGAADALAPDAAKADAAPTDTGATDTGAGTPDTALADGGAPLPDTAAPDAACDEGCGCFPCIK